MKTSKLILALIAFAIVAVQTACNSSKNEEKKDEQTQVTIPDGWKDYTDATNKFGIAHPADWEEIKDSEAIIGFLAPRKENELFQMNINVMIEDTPTDAITLDEYAAAGKNQIEQSSELQAKVVDEGSLTINGNSARYMTSEMVQMGIKIKTKQVFLKRGKQFFIISAALMPSNFDKDVVLIDKIFNTFRFL